MQGAIVGSIRSQKAGLALSDKIAWHKKSGTHEFKARLRNSLGHPLVLFGQYTLAMPHRFRFIIHNTADKSSNVFRLCVRGSHGNAKPDGRVWDPGTHLHVWSWEHGDKNARDPWAPWPPVPWDESSCEALSVEEMKDLFHRFCGMLSIDYVLDDHWVDPPAMPETTYIRLPDGEEVP